MDDEEQSICDSVFRKVIIVPKEVRPGWYDILGLLDIHTQYKKVIFQYRNVALSSSKREERVDIANIESASFDYQTES